ncbi:YceD family protein [Pararhizobium haloflavum]|uniref:YceD family protein n=1 Tax=Pararhizobium haloflavum TaxID=2037914 RepID=UPI000C192AD9|nr:YceD family protein [Pararhizobium haloflavum]
MSTTGPFAYKINVGHVSANPLTVKMEADMTEREALARDWGVSAVLDFAATFEVVRWKRDGVRLTGTVKCRVEQPCVVTLEPVVQNIEEPVSATFVPDGSKLARMTDLSGGEIVIDAEGPDMPEPFAGDVIDAGAVAAEFAAMAIDRYPRKPGVRFGEHIESRDDDGETAPSPFAALKDWKGGEN